MKLLNDDFFIRVQSGTAHEPRVQSDTAHERREPENEPAPVFATTAEEQAQAAGREMAAAQDKLEAEAAAARDKVSQVALCLSLSLSVSLCLRLFLRPFLRLCLSVYLSFILSLGLSVSLSLCDSVTLSLSQYLGASFRGDAVGSG